MTQRAKFYGNGNRGPSLGDQIAAAESIADIHALLATGEAYLNATQRTKNSWRRIASRHREELQGKNGAKR